jgi:hypothetical protein
MDTTQEPEQQEPNDEPAPADEWLSARNAVQQNEVQVKIKDVKVKKIPLEYLGDESESKDELLAITVEITNLSPTQKTEYDTWQGGDFVIGRDFATLKDNYGNSYKRISFGIGTDIVGSVKRSESVYPNKSITDTLVFEQPIENTTHLDLELPASNFGGTGMLRIRIPDEMLRSSMPDPVEVERLAAEQKAAEQAAADKAAREAEAARLAEEEKKFRTWTAKASGRRVEAKLISYANGVIILESRQGKRTRVALDKLSEADNAFVKKWRAERN